MNPGQVVAERFEIDRPIGTGGMGVVYRARDRQTGEPIALKLLHDHDEEMIKRFVREAQLLSELQHPGVVRYVAHGRTATGANYLAMEWLEGEPLSARLARARLGVSESLALIGRVAEALAAAHARGIVHRDLKPPNLFLVGGRLDQVKILDFGIARLGHRMHRGTQTGVMIGTPGYMAPEQARGAADVDARADVFSLGCVLFECLTGRPAYVGEHVFAVLAKILLEESPRVSQLLPDVGSEVDELIARMLAKDPAGRPADAAALLAELAALGTGGARAVSAAVPAPVGLGRGEQRLLCVILSTGLAPWLGDAASAPTLPPGAPRAALHAAVTQFGGHLEQLAGGFVVVTLSGAGSATDLATRAARCALAVATQLPEAPVALATGRGVVTGQLPIGDVIDRAARLIGRVPRKPDRVSVRLDDVTAGLLDARFDVGGDAMGLALLGVVEGGEGQRRLLGKPTTFVGREREIAMLEGIFAECMSEPIAQVVLVTAPAGAGKSRLRHELVRRIIDRGERVQLWIGRGDAMSAGSPFVLLAHALRREASLQRGEPMVVSEHKLRARVGRHLTGEDHRRVSMFLGELLGIPFDDEHDLQLRAARRDPVVMGDQMRRAWEDFLGAETAAQGVLLVLEDLHWGDLPTVKFVDSALRLLSRRPIMVLALARPDVHDLFPGLWTDRNLQEVRLRDLTDRASEKLARQVLGADRSDDEIARIVQRAAGNAFYLEELLRASSEGQTELPATVVAMMQARVEGLPPELRQLLRAASVFGENFWEGGVRALLADGGGRRLQPNLLELAEREWITRRVESKRAGEPEFVFRHALVREAAYAMLTDADRALGHRLAGAWLETTGEVDGMMLGEHFERGGEPNRAIRWYQRAALHALEGNDLAVAIARAARGIACGAEDAVRGVLLLIQAEAHHWRGENADSERCGVEALAILPRHGADWFVAAGQIVSAAGRLGHTDLMVDISRELVGAEIRADTAGAYGQSLEHTVEYLVFHGEYGLADELIARVDEAALLVGMEDPMFAGRVNRAVGMRNVHEVGTLLVSMQAAARNYVLAGDLRRACDVRMNEAYALIELGQYARSEQKLRALLPETERLELKMLDTLTRQNLGLALGRQGRIDEGRQLELACLDEFRKQGDRRLECASRLYVGMMCWWSGDLEEAEREIRQAMAIADLPRPFLSQCNATLATVLLARGRGPEALLAARDASCLLESFGTVEEGESIIRLSLAEALATNGFAEEAAVAASRARERVLERAGRIGDVELRRSFLEEIPENVRTMALR